MTGVDLSNIGTTTPLLPVMKRGVARLSTGQSVYVVPDTNLATSNGDDVTGVAKIRIYLSNDANRTAFTLARTHTPAVAMSSSTRYAVMGCAVRENNNLYVVYQGTDNSLRFVEFVFTAGSPGSYAAGTEQTIVASGAITNRFRAVDVDMLAANSCPVVAAYEANASTGQGAFARVYIRRTDGTTWIQAYSDTIATTDFIRPGGEDIAVAWDAAGASANVANLVVYYTKSWTTHDHGDTLRELSFNVSTGTANSATTIGTWYTNLYINQAFGARRGFLFSEANGRWMFGAVVGSTTPFFNGVRLTHNVFTGLTHNPTSVSIQNMRDLYYTIVRDNNVATAVGASFCDNALVFAYAGYGVLVPFTSRMLVIRFSSTVTNPSAVQIDTAARVLDNGYTLLDGTLAVYGGGNKNLSAGLTAYNFGVIYGRTGTSVSTTPGTHARKFRAVAEDTIAAPQVFAPNASVVTTDRPQIRVQGQNSNLYSNVLGKLQFQVASDTGFTANLQTITQADSDFQSFSATSGTVPPIRSFIYNVTQAQALFSGTWYIRSRVIDDLGGFSAWSTTATFTISHPPVALPIAPTPNISQLYGTGDVVFTWKMTDPETTDTQSAYRLVITRNDTGATVSDSGKVTSSAKSVTVNFASGLKDMPLQWTVSLWDSDDVQGPFSNPSVFTLLDPPDVVVTGPTEGGTINTALPTVTWTFTAGGTRTQRAFRVRIWNTDPNPDVEVADTSWIFSNAVTYSFTEQILQEGVNYRADVYVQDNVGLMDNDSNAFITDWLPPTGVALTVVADEFKATLTWTNAAQDPDWVGYRVYRRYMKPAMAELDLDNTATVYELLAEVTNVATSYTYYDYTMPLNKSVDYLVVQVADRFGSLLESDLGAPDTVVSPGDRYYFVPEVPVGTIASFEASYVTGDSFTRDIEQATLHVLGRGRQVQVGDDLGYSGTLQLKLRNPATARADREFLEFLAGDDAGNLYIRSPFGDVLYVSLGNPSFSRLAGVGNSDLGDLSIPYTTVYKTALATRSV
jgi:hypothetical protein